MTHTFSNNATLSFTKTVNDLYTIEISQGDQIRKIPLLINEFECQETLWNLKDIKWLDAPFSTFCSIITGLILIITKYKGPDIQALASKSPFTDPR